MKYLMKPLIIILIATLVACSNKPIKYNTIDPSIRYYYSMFERDYLHYVGNPLPDMPNIVLDDLEEGDGYYHLGENKTHIDRLTWRVATNEYRELLLYHEMGHHILKRKHKNEYLEDGCPMSLMYYKIYEDCYKKHKQYYKQELFSIMGEF